ncbi:VOC family protein [Rhodococcus sp. NPDC057529]|uniref:VOC family protein n=1 Tax=Rhodococcus sp. NPDC057529 TaxID=3346158 RepID=UPI00366F1CC2
MSENTDGDATALRVHAVLHCNLNTVDIAASETFYNTTFDHTTKMTSLGNGTDVTPMGLTEPATSDTRFLWDARGPRSAPSFELVDWQHPAVIPAPDHKVLGYIAAGFRVPSLDTIAGRLDSAGRTTEKGDVTLRGHSRRALTGHDAEGIGFEIVEVPPGSDEPQTTLFSHLRARCANLSATIAWYRDIGFEVVAGESHGESVSLALPEDPTFSIEFEQADVDAAQIAAHQCLPANTQGLYRIALAVDDVWASRNALADKYAAIPEPAHISMEDIPTGGFTILFLRDPDGTMVELVERPRSAVRRPQAPEQTYVPRVSTS